MWCLLLFPGKMGASDENNKPAPSVPSWQQAASSPSEDTASQTPSKDKIIEQAKKFLQDDEVKSSSREKKIEFLRAKGLEDTDINGLLEQEEQQQTQQLSAPPQSQPTDPVVSSVEEFKRSDHPPIITYPEFLTKPTKPPPLITATGLAHALAIIAGASTLVYGATRHLVSPMVDSLTEARIDFHHTTNASLARLVNRLEGAVSELPEGYYHIAKAGEDSRRVAGEKYADDDASDNTSYEDPSELFHRDVGVQTSPPPSSPGFPPAGSSLAISSTNQPDPTEHQLDRLNRLSLHARALATDIVRQTEDLAETKNVLDSFGSDLHTLTYPPDSFGTGSSYLYGTSSNKGPEDEMQRVKTSIRSVKGVLLSTRSFPAGTR